MNLSSTPKFIDRHAHGVIRVTKGAMMSLTHATNTPSSGSARQVGGPPGRVNRALHPTVNTTAIERAGCVLLGTFAAVVGTLLLTSAGAIVAVVLEVLLIAAGLDLVVTGALGHCPLYNKLGYVPSSLRRPS